METVFLLNYSQNLQDAFHELFYTFITWRLFNVYLICPMGALMGGLVGAISLRPLVPLGAVRCPSVSSYPSP